MNLIDDRWIPVVLPDGKDELVSLCALYERTQEIRDLAVNPPQRVALMRLLICITQAALDGPADEDDWRQCRSRIIPESLRYLDKWRAAFDLYGERPFLQVVGLEVAAGKDKPTDFIDCRLSTGNNATLFDQGATAEGRSSTDAESALALLTFMNFSTSGKIGQAIWEDEQYSDSTFAGPAVKYAHTFIRGADLLTTVHANLLTKASGPAAVSSLPNAAWGRPVWENYPSSVRDAGAFDNAFRTYLGRLVPFSRLVLLDYRAKGCRCIVGPMPSGFRIDHLPAFREPWATVRQSKDGSDYYLPLKSDKHVWRELGGILAIEASNHGDCRCALPLVRLQTDCVTDEGVAVDVWVGGLELGDQAAKINDVVEWTFHLPLSLLHKSELARYQAGVRKASEAELALSVACKAYAGAMKQDNALVGKARTQFWSILDAQYDRLIDAANDLAMPLDGPWYPIVEHAMCEAYGFACPHTTPRQIQAFAYGLKALKLSKFGDVSE